MEGFEPAFSVAQNAAGPVGVQLVRVAVRHPDRPDDIARAVKVGAYVHGWKPIGRYLVARCVHAVDATDAVQPERGRERDQQGEPSREPDADTNRSRTTKSNKGTALAPNGVLVAPTRIRKEPASQAASVEMSPLALRLRQAVSNCV